MADPLLSVRGLEVAYGPVTAVRGLNLDVGPGEIVALLGANGAGKTSTLRGLTGLIRPRAGRVTFAGERLDGLGPEAVVARGVAHVPEGRRVFPGLSVADNLMLGAWHRRRSGVEAAQRQLVYDTFPRLAERRAQLAGSLSGGEQQMLAIGRALMSGPKLLLIDELSLGLSPVVVDSLLDRLGALNRDGLSLVLIEQFVHRALAVADRCYLLAKGRVQFAGTPREVADAGAVEIAYLSGGLGR
ncbi:MAG TPA: ABC transporter ATP-binding protein [Acidimicrobiia bacterium]|nr:ABC transporter ATP-binding protein [Acidimicrobiia bacterium]